MRFSLALFLFSFHFLFISPLSAQKDFSILYLRSGGVYVGKVLNDKGENIDMRLADGNEINFPKSTVKRHLESRRLNVYPDGKYNVTKGYFFNYGIGMNLESLFQDEEESRISSHMPFIFGTYLTPRWAVGGGFGFEFNEAEVSGFEFDTQVLSQFLYARYYLTESKRRPFAFARIGYGARGDDPEFESGNNGGGYNFQAGGGIHFSGRRKGKHVLSVGYHLQKTDGTERFIDEFGGEIIADYDILIRRLVLTFSAEFNRIPRGYRGERRR